MSEQLDINSVCCSAICLKTLRQTKKDVQEDSLWQSILCAFFTVWECSDYPGPLVCDCLLLCEWSLLDYCR